MQKTILFAIALSVSLGAPALAAEPMPDHNLGKGNPCKAVAAADHKHGNPCKAVAAADHKHGNPCKAAAAADPMHGNHDQAKGHEHAKGNPCAHMSPGEAMKKHHPVRGPLAPGLESFHDTLHVLVHEAQAKGDMGAIKVKLPELKRKADALAAVNLPPSARKQRANRDKLVKAVAELEAAAKDDGKKFEAAFDNVHHTFEDLAKATKNRP